MIVFSSQIPQQQDLSDDTALSMVITALPSSALPMPDAPPPPPPPPPPRIHEQQRFVVRQVWAWNLRSEFATIAAFLPRFRFVAFDTEFPGCIIRSATPHREQSQDTRYSIFKFNVDCLKLIQLGLVLFDANGNLPDSVEPITGARRGIVWEFNFRFDVRRDPNNPKSMGLLRSASIDLDRLRLDGIDSSEFAALCFDVGLVSHSRSCPRLSVQWIAFASSYDFGYFVKILTRRRLPSSKHEFMDTVDSIFGKIIDIKKLMYHCGLHGGLECLANTLGVARKTGIAHQAGSDALLTYRVFLKIKELFFQDKYENLQMFEGKIPF